MKTQKKSKIYGVVGMVGLFIGGIIVGYIINGSDRVNHSIMTREQCAALSSKMGDAVRYNRYDEIAELNKIYSENCLNRDFDEPKSESQEPQVEDKNAPKTTCEKIEYVLLQRLYCADGSEHCMDAHAHIENAKIYANLAERGCTGNVEKYKQLAKQELEIARALNDDDMVGYQGQQESVEIVETYKRLQMQADAERMIEKAKRLTNPAIDFILELEKILEE